ncbi:MAG: SDR family oxidoreductase [Pseudomonadales bacterium]|nr:SDR family oxidoreductase [Pseudomonadales bacterium]
MKKILVLGSSGATGKLVVAQLLEQNVNVVAILRSTSSLPEEISSHTKLHLVRADITDLQEQDLANYLQDCTGVISCLGHNLTLKGMFGEPRLLVTDTIKKICRAVERIDSDQKIKVILMNTTGNCNHDIPEKPPLSQRVVISILRWLLPPHADNEKAANFLRLNIGQNHKQIEWAAVRPDALTDDDSVSEYNLCISPAQNAIFNAAATSRINVANFMSRLVCEDFLWNQWKGKMPVIYNRA